MNIELVGNLFMFAGGIGMFLYGMNIMADGMQKSAGSKMKQLIGYLTRNRLLAVLVGAFITAIIQSSGATTVEPASRSLMNVPFVTGDKELDAKFVKEAEAAGLVNLKGHRTVGGMRASIYNDMPLEVVEALIVFMKKFEEENA